MTKEEILNGMSEEEFYRLYPTREDWENSQQMKLGGLSGAPHNGQPTADQFFSYGSHANDKLNIPMSNPFYLADGGTYYGGPIRPYDDGGNMASPTNYGAFNVPMEYGGYEEYGGVLDPSNNQDYPMLETGGRSTLQNIIKAASKKLKKEYGGDTVMQGGNSDNYPQNITNNFKNAIKRNMYNSMINEEEKAASEAVMQMGGYPGGMYYNQGPQLNPQNQMLQSMYQQRIDDTQANLRNDFSNLMGATQYLQDTANPYTQTTVKAEYGGNLPQAKYGDWDFSSEYQKSKKINELRKALEDKKRISMHGVSDEQLEKMAREEGLISDITSNTYSDNTNYNKYFNNRNYYGYGQGMNYFPMNYNPYGKISKKDVALMQQLAANPTTNLKEFSHRHFGPWGKTKMTFGYKDQTPYTEYKGDPIQVDLKNNPNTTGFNFQEEATLPLYGPRIDKTPTSLQDEIMVPNNISNTTSSQQVLATSMQDAMDNSVEAIDAAVQQIRNQGIKPEYKKYGGFYQDGGFKSSRLGPQGQTVEMMMNPFNYNNYKTEEDLDTDYYVEPVQTTMSELDYDIPEISLKQTILDNPSTPAVVYTHSSDNKPKITNTTTAVSGSVKAVNKPTKGVPTPVKKQPAPRTVSYKQNVRSTTPLPAVTQNDPDPYNKTYSKAAPYANFITNVPKSTPKKVSSAPVKKLTQNAADKRKAPQSGIVVDKRTNQAYYIGDKGETGSFPVLTGKNVDLNYNPYTVEYLENYPNLRNTPVGYYKLNKPEINIPNIKNLKLYNDAGVPVGSYYNYLMKDYAGKYREITPISAYGQRAPVSGNLGFHRTYSSNANNPNDPEFRRREALYSKDPNMRCTSFGCVNLQDASYDEIARVFPTSDTLMVLDSKNPLDAQILNLFKNRARQKEYGGLTKAQYGRDHKSTNPADGLYDMNGNPVGVNSPTGNMGLSSNPISMGNSFQPIGNAPGAAPMSYEGPKTTPAFSTPESVGLQQKNIEMKGMGRDKEATITTKQRPGFSSDGAMDWTIFGINALRSGIDEALNNPKNKKRLAEMQLADNAFVSTPGSALSQGDYDPNSGMFRPNQMVPVQFPGYSGYNPYTGFGAYGGSFQDGGMYEEGEELDLSPEEIEELRAQGYDIEYLD